MTRLRRAGLVAAAVALTALVPSPARAETGLMWTSNTVECGRYPIDDACRHRVWRTGPNGENPVVVHEGPGIMDSPHWTRDGSRGVFHRSGPEDPTACRAFGYEVFSISPTGADEHQLTEGPAGQDMHPRWSPDGSMITWQSGSAVAVLCTTANPGRVNVMNADGSGKRQLTDLPGSQRGPEFTADGRRIVFTRGGVDRPLGPADPLSLWSVDVDGNNLRQISFGTGSEAAASFSPDGRWIAFFSGATLFIAALDGSVVQPYSVWGNRVSWSPDSRSIVLSGQIPDTPRGGAFRVDVGDPEPKPLMTPPLAAYEAATPQYVGDAVPPKPTADVAPPVAIVGSKRPRIVGMTLSSVRSIGSKKRNAPVKVRRGGTLALLSADRTAIRGATISLTRAGARPRWKRVRNGEDIERMSARLAPGGYTLRVRTRDARGNRRSGAVAVRVGRK